MIRELFTNLANRWHSRRTRREAMVLGWIKARYHIFRVLLANNERALEGMAEVDRLLRENEPSRLPDTVRELRETVLELADGLNRLTDNAHTGLYPRLESLERGLDEAVDRYSRAPRRMWLPLAEVTPDMREQAGGKAQPLGTLARAGLPVPEGVCFTRRACREYLRRAHLEDRLKALLREAASGGADLDALSGRARSMIAAAGPDSELDRELPAAWEHLSGGRGLAISVRSSASSEDGTEHSFAGQYASVLGVRTPEAMTQAFKTVLASAFSARAMAYRAGAGLAGESVDMAVLCQRMVDARASGVLFSVDPMAPACGRMLLTAVPGLGTQAVSGRAPADVYRPARDPRVQALEHAPAEIAVKTVREVMADAGGLRLEDVPEAEGTLPLLSPGEIGTLRDHALRIEALAGCAQDIEWAVDHQGMVWILQARPARLARPAHGGQSCPPTQAVQAGQTGQSGQSEQSAQELQSGQSAKPVQDVQTNQVGTAGQPGHTGSLDRPVQAVPSGEPEEGHPGTVGQACLTDCNPPGQVLLSGGVGASPGKAAGRLAVVRSRQDLAAAAKAPRPVVLALHQSLVDAASLVPEAAGLLVDMGNPLDHLAGLSRELGIPMITGLGTATSALVSGDWVLVDADRGMVLAADPLVWQNAPKPSARKAARPGGAGAQVRDMILPLNLTDAYGPTFSIMECKSLHDLVRYTHEKAVIALFEAGDAITGETFSLVRRLKDDAGLSFFIIDLGGGLVPGRSATLGREDILCEPLGALCRGMSTPGLRWGTAPPITDVTGLMTRSLLDARSERPVGNPNYALVSRDYLNLNARVDYHFAMVDAVCGINPRENSIRFRFKGGGTARIQRERRAVFVETVLREEEFFTTRQGDMVTAVLMEGSRESIRAKMEMLGRFLGFSRLLDASMINDDMPRYIADAFLAGDYALNGLEAMLSGGK